MFSTRSLTAISALMGSALTQSTSVTSLLLYGFEGDNIVASVMSAAPQATEYFVTCAPGTDGSDCGFGPGVTFTEGPSTLGIHLTESGVITMDVECAIASQTADCTQVVAGAKANDPGTSSAIVSDISESLAIVTITAGLDLLSGASSATTTVSSSATGTTTEATTRASATGTAATKTASSTASGSATQSAAATGAAHRTGQNVVAAGLFGLIGMALVL
ncbi:hypothetical protein N0V93_009990 [Gnomoniopsis smithogilvyi]|uniref:GPI anchored protein n=1 Tax=Gnomoniopsis smithogilvyi TaxID=1191159 RepID=A0A9W8YKB1_9PEZI|nr:hypothetical protein N0V93_009990 [Gnomoniopsis smithogilvyi]